MVRVGVLALLIAATAGSALAQVPIPTLEGPVSGGNGTPFIAATTFDLAQVGYTQSGILHLRHGDGVHERRSVDVGRAVDG